MKIYLKGNVFMSFPLNLIFWGFFFISIGFAETSAGQEFAFSWKANPPEDNVVGYRLYYGTYSRFDSTGRVKPNFFYEHYIDIAEFKRCDVSSYGESCEILHSDDFQCENLYQSFPKCTVFKLSDNLYFVMTAYNYQAESDYTNELFPHPKLPLPNPKSPLAILPIVFGLILNED